MIKTRQRRPLVSHLAPPSTIQVEQGDPNAISTERIALIAQYSAAPDQPRSLSEYVAALAHAGFTPIIISTCPSEEPLEFPHGLHPSAVVLRRPNIGYDFGSWASALAFLPQVKTANTVLLTNDSLLGPFSDIQQILEWACEPGPDIRSLTSSHQYVLHHQSYFLAFRGGILADPAWEEFFSRIRVEPDKERIVLRYEIELSRAAFSEGYSVESYVSAPELGCPDDNPTIDGWKAMLDEGIPFVKRTMLTHPDLDTQVREVRAEVAARYLTNIDLW